MEDIKERLGDEQYYFLKNFENNLNVKLHFFGSIKRYDYFQNSDIDIIIITDNVKSVVFKAQQYLNIENTQQIFQQHSIFDKEVITGYKIKYKQNTNNISFDLLIYDEKYAKSVLKNIDDINNLPFYMVILLCIIKFFYYNISLISTPTYEYLKCCLFFSYFNKNFYNYKKDKSPVIAIENF